jgi:hypothetical protein
MDDVIVKYGNRLARRPQYRPPPKRATPRWTLPAQPSKPGLPRRRRSSGRSPQSSGTKATAGAGEECQVLLKTTTERYPGLERHLVEHHPWDNPEMTAVQISAGSSPYLEWVRRATAGPH